MPTKVNIEQEEQKIFNKLYEKGFTFSNSNGWLFIKKYSTQMQDCTIVISIDKYGKEYRTDDDFYISSEIHQLLHKLFELWWWFDE